MRAREMERAFGLARRFQHVADGYAGQVWMEGPTDVTACKYLAWLFGFKVKRGDLICAAILRKGAKPKKARK